MKKNYLYSLLLLLMIGFTGCKTKEELRFESLMGKGKPLYEHISSPKDFEMLKVYESQFEQKKGLIGQNKLFHIPKVVHIIWLGPSGFPEDSKKNVASWIEKHPDYLFKFWSDRKRALPHPTMQFQLVGQQDLPNVYQLYELSDNYGEKADLLRYEILYKEGGIYVDHDVICYKNFNTFVESLDLFVGLEPPHRPVLPYAVSVCNNIIGVRPNHQIFEECFEKIRTNWFTMQRAFPGSDKESVIYRVWYRTFMAFDQAIYAESLKNLPSELVLPAGYFNKIDGHFGIYAHHDYKGSWYQSEDPFEKLIRNRFLETTKKLNVVILIGSVATALNFIAGCYILLQLKRRKNVYTN
jgi:hypothetical protein